jgi:hypothetical protein
MALDPVSEKLCEAVDEIQKLKRILGDVLKIAETSSIPDRHGNWHQACDTTCLNDIAETIRKIT